MSSYNIKTTSNLDRLSGAFKALEKKHVISASLKMPEVEFSEAIGELPTGKIQSYTLQQVDTALSKAKGDLAAALNAAMTSSSWQWTSGGSRDIIDTGSLKNSLTITFSGGSFQISYSEPYAALVHWGGYIYPYGNQSAQKVYLPGRPWVEATVMGGGPVPQIQWQNLIQKYL